MPTVGYTLTDLKRLFFGGGREQQRIALEEAWARGITAAELLGFVPINDHEDGYVPTWDDSEGAVLWSAPTGGGGGGSGDVATDTIWNAAGDQAVGTGSDTAHRVAKGVAGQFWRTKADGSTLEWGDIADGDIPSGIARDTEVTAAVAAEAGDRLAGDATVDDALDAHEAATTTVHGIADTSTLYRASGTDVAVADGGTGSSTASGARTNLGLVIGTDVQAHTSVLDANTASFTTAKDTKLSGIATGATANSADATLLDRLNHTGTQAESTVTNLVTDLAGKASTSTTISAGTGLTGGGDLSANRTLTVAYGTSSSTACVGNDTRLSDARTPTTHATSHAAAGGDPLTLSQSQVTSLTSDLALKAPLASPTLTGTPAAPTAAQGTNTTQVATTAMVQTEVVLLATKSVALNNQTGTTYTLVLTDAGKVVEANNASAITLTVPPNSSVAFPIGTTVEVWQQGAGQVTVTAGAGVTLRARNGAKTGGQYALVSLLKRGTDEWVVAGDTTT